MEEYTPLQITGMFDRRAPCMKFYEQEAWESMPESIWVKQKKTGGVEA